MCAINSRKSGSQRKAHFGSLSLLRVSCKQESTPPCLFSAAPRVPWSRASTPDAPVLFSCYYATRSGCPPPSWEGGGLNLVSSWLLLSFGGIRAK